MLCTFEVERDGQFKFTDDTAMARSVANSLIAVKVIDAQDMAERFVAEFFRESWRGYGGNVVKVFKKLKENNCNDLYRPAAEQFNGKGSYGNGGAMRICPLALFCYNFTDDILVEKIGEVTRITHNNDEAISGAVLQCAAVQLALRGNVADKCFSRVSFLQKLIDLMERIDRHKDGSPSLYVDKLKLIQGYLTSNNAISTSHVVENLGNDVTALGSVPAALYSFLRSTSDVSGDDIPSKYNGFEKTIINAISLGGDTDTIATMAGAIAGAHYGIEAIPVSWSEHCEGVEDADHQACVLHDMVAIGSPASQPCL